MIHTIAITLTCGEHYHLSMGSEIPDGLYILDDWELDLNGYVPNVRVRFTKIESDLRYEMNLSPSSQGTKELPNGHVALRVWVQTLDHWIFEQVAQKCTHNWADTGFSFTYCKTCQTKGHSILGNIQEVA